MAGKLTKLEMLRGFAAVYVFAAHVILLRVLPPGSPWRWPWSFGQEVVVLFFLLSGFVIRLSVAGRPENLAFGTYLARRARRIYPIFLLALGLSYALHPGGATQQRTWFELLGNLLMLQDYAPAKPGVWVDTFCGNLPLWSLSYEWWFYMLFYPFHRWVPPERQLAAVFTLSVAGFISYQVVPNQVSLFALYFLLWWGGVELAKAWEAGRIGWREQSSLLWCLGTAGALVGGVAAWAVWRHRAPGFGYHPILEARHFAAALVAIVAAVAWAKRGWAGFARVFGPFARFAPISYALYVFHFPICVVWWPELGIASPLPGLGLAVGLTVLAAWVAENPFQGWVNRQWLTGSLRTVTVRRVAPGRI